jgi:hypothetical protein
MYLISKTNYSLFLVKLKQLIVGYNIELIPNRAGVCEEVLGVPPNIGFAVFFMFTV